MASLTRTSGRHTAKLAVQILIKSGLGFQEPTRQGRLNLCVAFAKSKMTLHREAFDLIKCETSLNLSKFEDIESHLKQITVYEVKSTRLKTVGTDLHNYFFSMSTAELLAAQSLKNQYRFAFVNIITHKHVEMSMREVLSKARIIYPTWSIRF